MTTSNSLRPKDGVRVLHTPTNQSLTKKNNPPLLASCLSTTGFPIVEDKATNAEWLEKEERTQN
jgi:hypothetical protein